MTTVSKSFDAAVRAASARYYRLTNSIHAVFLTAWAGAVVYSFLTAGPLVATVVFLILYLVDTVPLFDVQTEGVLAANERPEVVREDLASVVSPLSALSVAWADEVHEDSTADSGAAAVLEGTHLKLFAQEYRIHVTSTTDDTVRVQFGADDEVDAVTELLIRPAADGTRVDTTTDRDGERLLGFLYLMLHGRFERQVLEHFGYHSVEHSTSVDLRLG